MQNIDTHLFLDGSNIEHQKNTRLVLGKINKETKNPLLRATEPWEGFLGNFYGNVFYDEEDQLFKCWYNTFLNRNSKRLGLCYATSRDGINWEKPKLDVVDFNGSKDTNLVKLTVHGPGVIKDTRDPDPDRRYKMFYGVSRHLTEQEKKKKRFWAETAVSSDGLHWRDGEASMPVYERRHADTHNNFIWDERSGKYVVMTRTWTRRRGEGRGRRLVARMESDDFHHWSSPVDIVRELPEERGRREAYTLVMFPYANAYLGFLMLLNTETGKDTVDCELVWSPDTRQWTRIFPGQAFIPRSQEGFDTGTIFATHTPIVRGNEVMIYYAGFDRPHGMYREGGLGLAKLRKDGWVHIEPQDNAQTSEITTMPVKCTGRTLRVNTDATDGELRVGILGSSKYSVKNCRVVRGDATDHEIRWVCGGDLTEFLSKEIQLQFSFKRARLYSFGFGNTSPRKIDKAT